MPKTMISRITRAVITDLARQAAERGDHVDAGNPQYATIDGMFDLTEVASTVLTAMREPTEAMQIAALQWVVSFEETQDIFRAMIDAALAEGQ